MTPAQAAPVTVGSPLTASFNLTGVGGPYTTANTALGEAGVNVTSPVDGVVVAWQIGGVPPYTEGTGFRLRVLEPAGKGSFSGVGTSAPAAPIGTPTPTSLPIKAGDLVGVDIPEGSKLAAGIAVGSENWLWKPQIAEGEPSVDPVVKTTDGELAFNAEVMAVPGITALIDPSGPISGGTSVVIAGHDFTGANAVRFGASAAASFSIRGDNAIVATTPASSSLGTVHVRVTAPGGISPQVDADRFTYTATSESTVRAPAKRRQCVVPELTGKSLKAAKKRLNKAGCKLGEVRRRKTKGRRVRKQSPRPGTVLAPGSKVNVKIG
jgi:hypothetical protein